MVNRILIFFLITASLAGCNSNSPEDTPEENGTPVTVVSIGKSYLNDTLSLYGTLIFLIKTDIISPISGFVQSVNAYTGDVPDQGKILFTIQTKEAAAYPKEIADTLFKNSLINIKAGRRFQIDSVLIQSGDFVQEGEVLCQTVDPSSMVVLLNFPFEKNNLIKEGRKCGISFPDGKKYTATVSKVLPEVDAVSQTQLAYVSISGMNVFPENLNVNVNFTETATAKSFVLPKSAILTDETMNVYWVMKLMNDSIAVKQIISIGRTSKNEVEITAPSFNADDRILVTGNYGLPDTAKVKILK